MMKTLLSNPKGPVALPHLVIDDGQKLPPDFYLLCQISGAEVTAFVDGTQYISTHQSTPHEITKHLGDDTRTLAVKANHRGSLEIARLAEHYRVGPSNASPPLPSRRGPIPILTHHSDHNDFIAQLSGYVSAHPERVIGVLCLTDGTQRRIHDGLARRGHERNVQVYLASEPKSSRIDFSTPGVHIYASNAAQGLTFDTVFIPDLENYHEDHTSPHSRMHALLSRARDEVYLACLGPGVPAIVADVPDTIIKSVN